MPNDPKCPPAIVVIEDDPNVSRLLTLQLERNGWSVRVAGSLRGARELFRSGEWDLALVDRGLPDGDGLSICSELRAASEPGYIIMLTGESSAEAKLEGFHRGVDDYVTKPFQIDELTARIRAGLRIVTLQKALIASNRQLEELSLTDGLTKLRNRRAFDTEIASRFEQARRYDRPMSVALIDVDLFKNVNDKHGHQAGDAVLRGIANLLESETRSADFVARYGGEEFAVILPETTLLEAMQFAEKIRCAIADSTIRTRYGTHQMTISVGVASTPHSLVGTAAELVYAADQALYRAKHNGRNRIETERRRERFANPLGPATAHLPLSPEIVEAIRLRSDRSLLQR